MPNISAYLVTEFGWRSGSGVRPDYAALVVPLVLRLVISRPEDVAQLPDDAKSPIELPVVKAPLRTKSSWVIEIFGFWSPSSVFYFVCSPERSFTGAATDRGINLQAASSIAAAAGVWCLVSAYGALVDRWDTRHALWQPLAFKSLGNSSCSIRPTTSGFCWARVVLVLAWAASCLCKAQWSGPFGRASFGRVMGAMRLPMSVIHWAGRRSQDV